MCNNHGIYNITNNECKCSFGYVTYTKDSNKVQCNYQLRSYSVAKFISLFGGVLGADMFYLGYTMKGLFKCFFPLTVFFVVLKLNNKAIEKVYYSYYLIFTPIILVFLLWSLDLMLIISGLMDDANGFALI